MRNPINHNKLLLQISLFLGIAHYLINMYLCRHKLRVIFYINYNNGSLKFEITAKRLYAASQRVL